LDHEASRAGRGFDRPLPSFQVIGMMTHEFNQRDLIIIRTGTMSRPGIAELLSALTPARGRRAGCNSAIPAAADARSAQTMIEGQSAFCA
jgi:hypothetical protein